MKQVVIALDIGGSSIKSAVVARDGSIFAGPATDPVDSGATAETILAAFTVAIRQHQSALAGSTLLGVGVGMPGPFDYENGISLIRGVAKYEAIYGLNIRRELQHRLREPRLPICFRNDAEAAIVGEGVYGAGRSYRRLIGITLGTGLGSAFLVDGRPLSAGPGVAPQGWLYHLPLGGGIADDVFSTRGLLARLAALPEPYADVARAADAARAGDTAAQAVFRGFGEALGAFLAPHLSAFAAEALLVLGGIGQAYDLFGPALAARLPIPSVRGALGRTAPLLGAADLLFTA